MDDIIRGRLDIEDGAEVARVAQAMQDQTDYPIAPGGVTEPRTDDAGVVRYPRYHVVVRDEATGLTHEWQIGTKATSTLYETTGIGIPLALEAAAKRLGKKFSNDLHDIDYDLFRVFVEREPAIASELGIRAFQSRLAEASQRSALGAADTALATDIAAMHSEATRLLEALVDRMGADYVAALFH